MFPESDRSDNILFLLEDRDASSGLTSESMGRMWDCVGFILLILHTGKKWFRFGFFNYIFLMVTFCKTLPVQNRKHCMRNCGLCL